MALQSWAALSSSKGGSPDTVSYVWLWWIHFVSYIFNKNLTEIAFLYTVFLWMCTEISGVWLCEGNGLDCDSLKSDQTNKVLLQLRCWSSSWFLSGADFCFQTSWFLREGAVQEPDSPECSSSAACEQKKYGFSWVCGMWTHEGAKDENQSLEICWGIQCWWQSHRAQWQLLWATVPTVVGLLPVQQLAPNTEHSTALCSKARRQAEPIRAPDPWLETYCWFWHNLLFNWERGD